MRVVSYTGKDGVRSLGVFTGKGVVDLCASARNSGVSAGAFRSMAAFLQEGETARITAERLVNDSSHAQIAALGEVRLSAPVPYPGKIVAVGLNYRDHSMESGAAEPPKSPLIFAKFPTSICGPATPSSCQRTTQKWITKPSWEQSSEKEGRRSPRRVRSNMLPAIYP